MACPLLDALFSLAATTSPRSASIKIIDLTFSSFQIKDPFEMTKGSGAAILEYQAGKVIESRVDGIIQLHAVPARLIGELNYQVSGQGTYSATMQILAPEILAIAGTETYSVTFSQNAGVLNGSYVAVCGGSPTIVGPLADPDMVGAPSAYGFPAALPRYRFWACGNAPSTFLDALSYRADRRDRATWARRGNRARRGLRMPTSGWLASPAAAAHWVRSAAPTRREWRRSLPRTDA